MVTMRMCIILISRVFFLFVCFLFIYFLRKYFIFPCLLVLFYPRVCVCLCVSMITVPMVVMDRGIDDRDLPRSIACRGFMCHCVNSSGVIIVMRQCVCMCACAAPATVASSFHVIVAGLIWFSFFCNHIFIDAELVSTDYRDARFMDHWCVCVCVLM